MQVFQKQGFIFAFAQAKAYKRSCGGGGVWSPVPFHFSQKSDCDVTA